jgi:uracil-DNA glycosylase
VAAAPTVEELRAEACGCRACDLWSSATQTVFGEGPAPAPMMLVGEQPGDQEDRAGRPFVGPAGRVLDEALSEAGIDRSSVYVTNAVKHFRWKPRGKRRIHQPPNRTQVAACQPWFAAELRAVTPSVLVLMGAVAAQAVFGSGFRVTSQRGVELQAPDGTTTITTLHPSSILRGSPDSRKSRMRDLVDDLRLAAETLQRLQREGSFAGSQRG